MRRRGAHLLAALCSCCLISFFAPPVSASVPILEWTEVDVPGDNDLTVVSPSEVTDIAAGDNGVVYAIDGENGRIYRSANYGLDWEDITKYLDEAATLPATIIAVAPDNEGIVAVLADDGSGPEIFVSLDGGIEWYPTHLQDLTPEVVTSLAISPEYVEGGVEYREMAIGTAVWGDGDSNGEVYISQGRCTWPGWKPQEVFVDPGHIGADVATLDFSKDFPRDRTLLVVCSTGDDVAAGYEERTWLCLGERDADANTTDWDFLSPDYPVLVGDDSPGDYVEGDAVGVDYVRARLAQPSDYSSEDEDTRDVFLSVEREPDSNDDVYRVMDDDVDLSNNDRMDVDGGSDIDIWSIAYRGDLEDGTLLAGEREPFDTFKTEVHRCLDPFESPPDWLESTVPPTGPGHAVLAWAPDVSLAYCGTSSQPGVALDESAFSASTYGDLWRQMGLIDTQFTLCDLVVTPDGEDLFLATSNEFGPESVWQSFTDPLGERWERVLTVDSDSDAVILELSAEYDIDETIYVVEHNGTQVARTRDGGISWKWSREAPEPILHYVVVDEDTLVAAIPDGRVMKSENAGRSWDDSVSAEVDDINMLSLAPDGTVIAGSRNGYVSYSSDDLESFVRILEPLGTGDVQVIADVGFDRTGWVFAGTNVADEGLWRWHAVKYCDWQQMDKEIALLGDGQEIGGLLQGPEGTLYAIRIEPASDDTGGMTRWLCPTCWPCADLEYDHVIEGLPDDAEFDAADAFTTSYPVGTLWSNDVETDVFVIDSIDPDEHDQRIWLFRDTLCKRGPDLESPPDGAQLDANACACNEDAVVAFDWEELDEVDEYEWGVYLDGSLSEPLWSELSDYEGVVISPWGDTTDFHSGMRYGWRVRTTGPLLSPWSILWTFTPVLCPVESLIPDIAATGVALMPVFTWDSPCEVDGYEFMLSEDPSFADAMVSFSSGAMLTETMWRCDRELEPSTHYFWRVRSVRGDARGSWIEGHFTTGPLEVAAVQAAGQVIDVPAQQGAVSEAAIWVVFGLAVVLLVAVITLVMRTALRN